MSANDISIAGLPALRWLDVQGTAASTADGKLTMEAGKCTDWFNAPPGPGMPTGLSNAPVLVLDPPDGDWQLSACVTIVHKDLFDAGTLFVHQGK